MYFSMLGHFDVHLLFGVNKRQKNVFETRRRN